MMFAVLKKKEKLSWNSKTFIDQCDRNIAPSWRDWPLPGRLWPPDGDVELSTESLMKSWAQMKVPPSD